MTLQEKNPTRNKITTLVVSLGGYYYGFSMPIFNSMAGPVLRGHFGLSPDEADSIQGNLNFFFCFAATLGVVTMSYLNDKFGRITTSKGVDISILSLNLLFLVDNIYALEATRLIGGFLTGIYNASPSLILVAVMNKSNSEFGNLMVCAFIGLFGLVSFAQQVIFSPETMQAHWKLLMIWPTIFSAFRLAYMSIYLKTDTPVFVYQQNSNSPDLKQKLMESFQQVYSDTNLAEHVEKFIAEREADNQNQDEASLWERYKQLFAPTYFRRTVGCLMLRFLESFTGYPVLCFISTSFFTRMGLDGKFISVVFGVFSVVGSLSGIYFVGKFKRVPTMLGGALTQGGSFLIIWIGVLAGSQSIVVLGLAAFLLGYWAGIGGVSGLYIAETIPAVGIGLCTGLSWFTWSFIAKWCVSFTKAVGETNTLFFFALVCVGIYLLLKATLVEITAEHTNTTLVPLIELSEKKSGKKSLMREKL